jgi:hypothetical protein
MSKAPKRYTQLPFALDILESSQLKLLNPALWDDRNDAAFLDSYRERVGAKSIYALCLTTASATYLHWKIYAQSGSGVCIHLAEAPLRSWASRNDIEMLEVRYLSLAKARRAKVQKIDLPRLKRHAFEDELELRMLYKSGDPQLSTRSFKFSLEIIAEIELNPWLPESVFESIRSIIGRIDGCMNIPVTQSHMLTNVEWRNLLTRVT